MFKRKKTQVRPALDPYITRRYDDLAVCIHYDLKNGRGLYSYYAPWLETMLVEMRQKYSLLPSDGTGTRPALAWAGEDEAGPSVGNSAAVKKIHSKKCDESVCGVSEGSIETIYIGDQTGSKAPCEQSNATTSGASEHSKVRNGRPKSADCAPPEIPKPSTAEQNHSRLCIIL